MRTILCVAAASLIGAVGACARASLEPFILRGAGSTLYRLEMTIPSGGPDSLNGARMLGQSELEYPLDMFAAGLRWRNESVTEASRTVGLSLSAWTNVFNPTGKMKDSDWIGLRSSSDNSVSSILFKFSYTESRAEARWFGGEAGLDYGPYRLLGEHVRYGLMLRVERFDYELFGIEGWQRPPGGEKSPVDTLADGLVLTYGLTRVMPRLFADFRLAEGKTITWKAVFSGAPAFAWDHDDHVLRRKESETFAFGFEVGLTNEVAFRLSDRAGVVATGEIAYLMSKGTMDQRFYGDDPFTGVEDETGKTFKNVVTRIIGLGGGVSIGYRYFF